MIGQEVQVVSGKVDTVDNAWINVFIQVIAVYQI